MKTTKKKATKKTPKKKLTSAHRAAIGDALRAPLLALAKERPVEARSLVEQELALQAINSISGRDVAAALGVSSTSFYRDVLPTCGCTIEEIQAGAAGRIRAVTGPRVESPAADVPPGLSGIWWLTPLYPGENATGTATALAAAAAFGSSDYESQVAASLYWHSWASRMAPGGALEAPGTIRLWLNPVGAILGTIATGGRPIPTDDEIKTAPPALINFAAYVAGEVLDSERKYQPLYDEERQKAAARFLLKLAELGVTAAAKVLVRCSRTAASPEASNACLQIGRKLAQRENDRLMAVRLKQETSAPELDPEVYKILVAVE